MRLSVLCLSAAVLVTLPATSFAAQKVYSPEKGIVCDRASGFCADRDGISFGLSEEYLGDTREYAKFRKDVDSVGMDSFDTRKYTLINRTKCDHDKEVCKKPNGRVDSQLTDILFAD